MLSTKVLPLFNSAKLQRLTICHRSVSTQTQHSTAPSTAPYQYAGALNAEQRQFYDENGYLIIKSLVPAENLEQYHRRFNEYATGVRQPSKELWFLREVTALKADPKAPISPNSLYKINELYDDDVFFEYCRLPAILDHVQSITGPNINMINSMLISKPPDLGTKSSRHPLHQDLYYFTFRPADRIVCAWTAMEPIHRDNGCLVVIPGSHKKGLLDHENPQWEGGVNMFFDGVTDKSLIKSRVHLTMDPGDCVLFHSALVHGSGINRTTGFRKAISAHYAPVEAEFIDARGTKMAENSKQMFEALKKKYGFDDSALNDVDYISLFWKMRAKLVRGEGAWQF